LPKKSKDPWSFNLLVFIGALSVDNALLDLGANINLMPLATLRKIGDLKVQPTKMQLQLVDRSIKYPYGVVEDVLVRVDKFIFPVDFVIVDTKEDEEVQLILGIPFMIVDVDKGELQLRVQDEEVTFNLFDGLKNFNAGGNVYRRMQQREFSTLK